jgi:hypothetical protein
MLRAFLNIVILSAFVGRIFGNGYKNDVSLLVKSWQYRRIMNFKS